MTEKTKVNKVIIVVTPSDKDPLQEFILRRDKKEAFKVIVHELPDVSEKN